MQECNEEGIVISTSRTSDFGQFENAHICEIAHQATSSQPEFENKLLEGNGSSEFFQFNKVLSVQEVEKVPNHGNVWTQPTENLVNETKETDGRKSSELGAGLRGLNCKSMMSVRHYLKETDHQEKEGEGNPGVKGSLQTVQKHLEPRQAPTAPPTLSTPCSVRKKSYARSTSTIGKKKGIKKRLNEDLMLDLDSIKKKNKKKRRTNFAGFKMKKLSSNQTQDKTPSDLKTPSKAESPVQKPPKLAHSSMTNFKEIPRLQNLKNPHNFKVTNPGCLEVDFESLKRASNSGYNKYTDAMFHILDRLQKSKEKYVALKCTESSRNPACNYIQLPETTPAVTVNDLALNSKTPFSLRNCVAPTPVKKFTERIGEVKKLNSSQKGMTKQKLKDLFGLKKIKREIFTRKSQPNLAEPIPNFNFTKPKEDSDMLVLGNSVCNKSNPQRVLNIKSNPTLFKSKQFTPSQKLKPSKINFNFGFPPTEPKCNFTKKSLGGGASEEPITRQLLKFKDGTPILNSEEKKRLSVLEKNLLVRPKSKFNSGLKTELNYKVQHILKRRKGQK